MCYFFRTLSITLNVVLPSFQTVLENPSTWMLLTAGSAVSVQYVETEQLENIMVLPVVMDAKDSLDVVYGKIMFIHAGIKKVKVEALN